MRKITKEIVAAFMNREEKRIGNSHTRGEFLYLHGNAIACLNPDGRIEVTTAGWNTPTTRERLNGLPGVRVYVRDHQRTSTTDLGTEAGRRFADESLKIKTKRPAKGRPNTERLFSLLLLSSYLYIIEINQ